MREIWFWQRIVTPHIAGLAVSLARKGCRVIYVAQSELSDDRKQLGWSAPKMQGVVLRLAANRLQIEACVSEAAADSIHICQGWRGNGHVRFAQSLLAARGMRQWVAMETVNDAGWSGFVKRIVYAAVIHMRRGSTAAVLATGQRTPGWVSARGMSGARVFPFTYFLQRPQGQLPKCTEHEEVFRVGFVGKFVELKQLPLLIDALALLRGRRFELVVVGTGPLEDPWRSYASERLPGRFRWIGGLDSAQVPAVVASLDLLVLPSRHDGWGAVVSEALLAGTPAICSSACGAAEAVLASGVGGVFQSGDSVALASLLEVELARGKVTPMRRQRIADWACCLAADAGADYLLEIVSHLDGNAPRPSPPWKRSNEACAA